MIHFFMPGNGKYISFKKIVSQLSLLCLAAFALLFPQTAPNTIISNQAKASYQYKAQPADTTRSNFVLFTVLDAPNFEMAISNVDTLTFGKDTVTVRIVYTNVGNKLADSVMIEGLLPPAGLRFVPGSTGGTISGNSVTWRVLNVPSGRSDSVKVNVVVDSGLVMNSELQLQANLSWQSSTISASKSFVIATFPRLSLNIIPDRTVVGSGRSLTYRLVISNTGNTPSVNTIVYDTLSAFGALSGSSVAYDSISANKRLIKWNIGSVPAFSFKDFLLTVGTSPNIGHQSIRNAAMTYSDNVPSIEKSVVTIPVVPILPKVISIVPEPEYIFGQVNRDSSRISVIVKDSSNEALPDGTPVQFISSLGNFTTGANVVTTTIKHGNALATLRSVNVTNDIASSKITVRAGESSIGTIEDTTSVHFYPGAVTGVVVNGVNRIPFQGAIARVFNSQHSVVGADTTGWDGKFFIALNKDIAKYTLEILVIDKFGDSIKTVSDIDPTRFPLPPIVIPNIISGRIEYRVTGQPVPAQNVTVILDSLGSSPAARSGRTISYKTLTKQTSVIRVRESITDANGKFKFENLTPARYVISLDSTEYPNFNGFTFLTDTASGTFTINLSLQIVLDSTITVTASTAPAANAGDTVEVKVGIVNSGTAVHKSVFLIDTLSPFAAFVYASTGNFTTVNYDTSNRTVRWQRDTLGTLQSDSVTLRYVISRNIPDKTRIRNHFWFTSNIKSADVDTSTIIRSNGVVEFANKFIVPQDTIVAGDSIVHMFQYKNIGTDSVRNIRIVDTLFSAGTVGISMVKTAAHDSMQIVDSISMIYIGSIAPGKEDSVSLKLTTDFALRNGSTIASHAYLMIGDSIIVKRDTTFIVEENPSLPSFITVVKTANKKVAEIGDIVTYQIQITNASPQPLMNIGVHDLLPYAFQYIKKSARYSKQPIEPLINPVMNQLDWTIPDTLAAAASVTLVYQLAIGSDALESEGMNTAYASALTSTGTPLRSSPSQWQVTVRPGVFTEKGLIVGKIFYDDNRNTFQDVGENGEKGIELWMEDGTKIITGTDGKYSLPEVKPGQHVIRVNEGTLPKQTSLLLGNNAFAKDPVSRFVRVTEGGIAKANFYLKRSISDSIVQLLSKVNKLVAVRQAKPKYLYEDTLRAIRLDTVTMYVSFNYSGNAPLHSIVINDRIDDRMTIVPNSATYNGRRINPMIDANFIQWKLGAATSSLQGIVRYTVAVNRLPVAKSKLTSVSSLYLMSADSIVMESGKIVAENIVIDTMKNRIETSEVMTTIADPRVNTRLSDSIQISTGDDVFFKTSIFIDPKKNVKEAVFIDTIPSLFIINERTYSVNGIPVPSRNLSVRVRSLAISSSRNRVENSDLEFLRISSLEMTELLRAGKNEITYSARYLATKKDTFFSKHAYALIVDEHNDSSILHSKDAKIYIRSAFNTVSLSLETTYVDIPRTSIKVSEKVADAIKLVESLGHGSAKAVVMDGITFELSKATLTSESKVVLDKIAQILLENVAIKIQINGYTDNTGNTAANRTMSLNRAKEVAQYLMSKGIDSKRLRPQGFGPAKPIASNKTEEGRSKNRRVEFAPLK